MKLDSALGHLRTLTEKTRQRGAVTVRVPIEVADAVLNYGANIHVVDLINALGEIDLADCSPRMVLRRTALMSRLRLDPSDEEAREQADDLFHAAGLRRRLRVALADALDAADEERARWVRDVMVNADAESLGWQHGARLVLGDERGSRA